VKFHQNSEILLTAGLDKKLRLFTVSDEPSKIQSIYFSDMPIFAAEYINDGTEIICTGNRKHMYSYSLLKQIPEKIIPKYASDIKDLKNLSISCDGMNYALSTDTGLIHVHDSKTKMLLYDIKVNGRIASVKFPERAELIIAEGVDGNIWSIDRRTRKCVSSMMDDGVISCTTVGISSRYYGSGCSSGAVNIYNCTNGKLEEKPIKQILNLTTKISGVVFNSESEICAIYSRWKKNSLKLVHMASMTVYSNFPSFKSNLKYVTALDYSKGSGYMCVANDTGRALLYKLPHYICT